MFNTNSILWFSAGVAATLFFVNGKGKKLIHQLESLPKDRPVSEMDLREAVGRVERKFNTVTSH